MIHHTVPQFFAFLKQNYEQLSSQQLKQRESDMDNIMYDPTAHVNIVLNKIQDFQDICNLVEQPKLGYQLVNIAYIIFQRVSIFWESLIRLNRRQNDKTYNDFKLFMRQGYNELAKVGGLTVGTSYGTANLVQDIHDIKQHTENLTSSMKEEFKQTLQAFYINQSETPYWSPPTQLPT